MCKTKKIYYNENIFYYLDFYNDTKNIKNICSNSYF